jgi:DNA-binding MarR family transcriptional regulator
MSTDTRNRLEGRLGFAIGSLSAALVRGLSAELSPFGVSPSQWAILETCFTGEATTPTEFAREIPIDGAAITRQLDKLEARKLLIRVPHPTDRRSTRVELTEAGREIVRKLSPLVLENNKRFVDALDKKEQIALEAILTKMLDHNRAGRAASAMKEEVVG